MTKHNYSVDFMRGIAAFGIVGCHLMLYPKTMGSAAVTALCDMFVGLFAALSGYWMGVKDLQQKDAGTAVSVFSYVSKRAKRIIPTYLAWSLSYVVFGMCFDLAVRKGLPAKWGSPGFWVNSIFFGGASCHLWFLVCLFYSQVILYVVTVVKRNVSWWVCLVMGLALIAVSAYSPAEWWWTFYPLRLFAFLVTGCGIARLPQAVSTERLGVWFGVLLASVAMHYGLQPALPNFVRDWFVVVPLLVVAVSARLPERVHVVAESLGKSSMGVFLVHPIFAAGFGLVFKRCFASPYGIVPWLLDWICCWGCSLLVSLLLTRIPYVRRIVV